MIEIVAWKRQTLANVCTEYNAMMRRSVLNILTALSLLLGLVSLVLCVWSYCRYERVTVSEPPSMRLELELKNGEINYVYSERLSGRLQVMHKDLLCPLGAAIVASLLLPFGRFAVRTFRHRRLRLSGPTGNTCQHCGYNLTGNVSGVCPECGTVIAPVEGGRQ